MTLSTLSSSDKLALQPIVDGLETVVESYKKKLLGNRLTNIRTNPQLEFNGPVVWLSADFRSLLFSTRIHHMKAAPIASYLSNVVAEQLGPEGSILVSTFNFDFPRTRYFDPLIATVQSGSFGLELFKLNPLNRTSHPIYSFLVFGSAEQVLLRLQPTDNLLVKCTGSHSIFEWLVAAKTELVTIGQHYVKKLTVIHQAEHQVGVPFRYVKEFPGYIKHNNEDKEVNCLFYAREIGSCDYSALTERGDRELRHQNLVQSTAILDACRPILIQQVNHIDAYALMEKDILKGVGSTVYTDYFGPNRPNRDVITHERADALYVAELKSY